MSSFPGFPGFPGFPPFLGMGHGSGSRRILPEVGPQGDPVSREFPPGIGDYPGKNNADAPRLSGGPQRIAGQLPEGIRLPAGQGGGYGGGAEGGMVPGQGGWGGMGGFPGGVVGGCQCDQCRRGRGW